MNLLSSYRTLRLEGLLDFLRKHSNPDYDSTAFEGINSMDFVAEIREEAHYPENAFHRDFNNITIEDRRMLEISQAEPKEAAISQFFGTDGDIDRLVAEVYAERGKKSRGGIKNAILDYEYFRIEFPQEMSLPSGIRIPQSTTEIQTEFANPAEAIMRRIDHIRAYWLFWRRANLGKILPASLFLNTPEMEHLRTQKKDLA